VRGVGTGEVVRTEVGSGKAEEAHIGQFIEE
jgi:hypothetical protein